MIPLVTREVAEQLSREGRTWRVRVVCTKASTNTHKFWECEGVGRGRVTVRWGRIGSQGQSITKDWHYFLDKVYEKKDKGYYYAFGTIYDYDKVPFTVLPTVPALPIIPPLTGPFALIKSLRPMRRVSGAVDDWEALDHQGRRVMVVPAEAAKELMRDYKIRVA